MKTLNKPETAITLLFFASCFIWYLYSDYLVLSLTELFKNNFFKSIGYTTEEFILIIASGALLFFFARTVRLSIFKTRYQYYKLFDHNPTPMAIVDLNTHRFLAVNKASIDCYGYSKKEFLNLTPTDIGPGGPLEFLGNNFFAEDIISKIGTREHTKKNGEKILTDISFSRVVFKNRECVMLLINDITEVINAREEKKIAEEESLRQQRFTSYVLENFPVDVAVFNKEHKYILLNKTAVRNDEMRKWMIGKDDFDYFARKGSDLSIAKKRRARFEQAIDGNSQEWIDEHEVDGHMKYVLRKFFPYKEDGELKYVYGYGTDITRLRKAELQMQEHLRQLEKIAFSTSHEIRQPICNLKGLITLLKAEDFDKDQIIKNMEKSVDNMDEFTRELGYKLHEYKQGLASFKNNDIRID